MKQSLCFIIYLLCILSAFAQKNTTRLSGKITDARTGEVLAGVSILLTDSRTGTTTDSLGQYVFINIPVGHNIIELSHLGYKTLVEHIDISENDTHDFKLEPSFLKNEGVTITAVANATSIRKAPITITRLTRAELLATTSTNIIDAISRQPGISQVSTGPAISKPIIRGLGYNRLVVINDGIRQEGQQWGDEHGIEIDEHSVNRVEIVKGPASLIYGSDAMAGVINIITTVPPPVETIRGSISSQYQTNNRLRSLFANIGGHQKGFNWNAWSAIKGAADYKNKWDGRVYNSKFNELNYGGYAGYNASWGFTHLIFSSFNQEAGIIEGERDILGRFIMPLPGGGEAVAGENDFKGTQPHVPYQDIQHTRFILDNSFHLKEGRLSLIVGWQKNLRKEFGNADEPSEPELIFNLPTFNYHAAYHFNHRNNWNATIGLNGMFQQNRNEAEEVLIPEYSLFDMGGFGYVSRSFGNTTISGGLRYDIRRLETDRLLQTGNVRFEGFRRNFSNASASVGISHALSGQSVIKFNLASGFRAPGISELSSNGAHEGTNRYEYGNRELKSERSLQADLGLEASSEHLSANVSLFYNHISRFIFYSKILTSTGQDSLVENDGEWIPAFHFNQQNANLYGAEFMIDIHPHPFDWLHWQNNFSFVTGRFREAIEGIRHLPLIPAPRWISELRAELMPQGKHFRNLLIHFDVDHSFRQSKAFTAFDTETPTPAYTLLNAGVSTAIMQRGKLIFQLYLNANNLTNQSYQTHLSRLKYTSVNQATGRMGVFNMGRNFSIRINIPFNF